MRNIIEYPITFDEKIETLARLKTDYEESGMIGGATSLVLDLIINDLNMFADRDPGYRLRTYPPAKKVNACES